MRLLKKYQNELSWKEKDAIIGYYTLNAREFMKGSDKKQVMNYLLSIKEPAIIKYRFLPKNS